MNVIEVPIEQLKPASYNPRKASEKQYQDLSASVKRFKMVEPIIVNAAPERKNIVIGGHFRLRVCKDLGMKTVPVVYVSLPDIRQEQELNLRLNNNRADNDLDLLANLDEALLVDVGFEKEDLDRIFDLDTSEDDFNSEAEAERITNTTIKPGNIIELGNHKLLCGDCTNPEDMKKLMGGGQRKSGHGFL